MASATLTQEQLVDLLTNVALLTQRVQDLTETVAAQEKEIRTLIALADRGRGSVWMLMAIGGFVGAAISNFKSLLAILLR